MFNLPNIFSFIRIPLAFAFLSQSIWIRSISILFALLSDALDGYYARKYNQKTYLGTILDPLTDRFFVVFALFVLFNEHNIALWKVGAFFARDIAIFLFGLVVFLLGKIYDVRALFFGKITTVLQFLTLFAMVFGVIIPSVVFILFGCLGVFTFVELICLPSRIADNFRKGRVDIDRP